MGIKPSVGRFNRCQSPGKPGVVLLVTTHCPATAVSPVVTEVVQKRVVDWHMPHVEDQAFLLGVSRRCGDQADGETRDEGSLGLLSPVVDSGW